MERVNINEIYGKPLFSELQSLEVLIFYCLLYFIFFFATFENEVTVDE
jgi:hypothetical protein